MDSETTIADAPMEMLATRRSKRSTAGNRMVAALAEIGMEELTQDPEEDVDFVNDKLEEDVFGSDFESTDEEAEKEAEVQGETEAVREERSTKKTARTRLDRITAAAHARNRQTFNPDIQIASKPKSKPKGRKTVRLGAAVDAETGQEHNAAFLREANVLSHPGQQRTSKRKHTVQSTTATATRVQQSQARKAALPKKTKTETRKFSQAELIAAALDTEEGNIIEHRDYLKNEEEKRKRARVVRTTISGPVLRWVSKTEQVKVPVPPPPPPPPPAVSVTASIAPVSPTLPALYRGLYGQPYNYATGTTSFSSSTAGIVSTFPATSSQSTISFSSYPNYLASTTPTFPIWPPPASSSQATHTSIFSVNSLTAAALNNTSSTVVSPPSTATATANPTTAASVISPPPPSQPVATTPPAATPPASDEVVPASSTSEGQAQVSGGEIGETPAAPEPEFKTETVTKNYLIHELDQQKSAPKPTWTQSMTAIFGDHVKWDQVKGFVGKQRPLHRPRQTCPITGWQAHYMDPRTGVPYADSQAYKILTSLLNHEYVWNPSLGCYTDHELPPVSEQKSGADAMDVDS
ncbi:hypothetical protein D9619_003597 [Psilocybe cf. subviscida]|uniref:Vps72/YL1 C-terminal domain-containing protein n=1 Tax=Psilocybe cf. subviscida TaxID=2480587 RepID=A0A8H5ETW2_9AGAR|nr:hypothetical protein D9619_003597 [Psilocybe cf. subviscida]